MHILHVTPYYAPAYAFGGVVRAVEGMAQASVARGHTVTVLTTDALNFAGGRITTPHTEALEGVRVVRVKNVLPVLRQRANLSTAWLRGVARDLLKQCDVVHVHEFRTAENIQFLPMAHAFKKPICLSPHGTLAQHTGRSTLKSGWDALISPSLTPYISDIVCLTENEKVEAQALWQRITPLLAKQISRWHVIPNGVNARQFAQLPLATPFRERWGLGDDPVILYMGRLHPRKGADKLAQAFINANLPHAKLVIAGGDEGLLDRLKSYQHENIVITGFLDGEARLEALSSASLFVLPAVGEGLSMAVLEAMACAVPVLLSPDCGFTDTEAQGAGRIVPPTIEALTSALTELLTYPQELKRMGENAQRWTKEAFSWEYIAEQLEMVYSGAISNSS